MGKRTIEFDFGEILMLFRVRAHLSKTEIAKHLGVTTATISNYEATRTPPSYRKMLKFKSVFGSEFNEALEIISEGGHFNGRVTSRYVF